LFTVEWYSEFVKNPDFLKMGGSTFNIYHQFLVLMTIKPPEFAKAFSKERF